MKLTLSIFAASVVCNLTQALDLGKYLYNPTENVKAAINADSENSIGIQEAIKACEDYPDEEACDSFNELMGEHMAQWRELKRSQEQLNSAQNQLAVAKRTVSDA